MPTRGGCHPRGDSSMTPAEPGQFRIAAQDVVKRRKPRSPLLIAAPEEGLSRMATLAEVLTSDAKKAAVVDDCCTLIDQEVSDKGGLSGIAIKAGYSAVKGIKPGFVKHVEIGRASCRERV